MTIQSDYKMRDVWGKRTHLIMFVYTNLCRYRTTNDMYPTKAFGVCYYSGANFPGLFGVNTWAPAP